MDGMPGARLSSRAATRGILVGKSADIISNCHCGRMATVCKGVLRRQANALAVACAWRCLASGAKLTGFFRLLLGEKRNQCEKNCDLKGDHLMMLGVQSRIQFFHGFVELRLEFCSQLDAERV